MKKICHTVSEELHSQSVMDEWRSLLRPSDVEWWGTIKPYSPVS